MALNQVAQVNPIPVWPPSPKVSRARRSSFTVYLPLLQTHFWNRRKSVYFLTNKHIQKGCVVPHRKRNSLTEQDTPKKLLWRAPAFPRGWFCAYYIQENILWETVPVCWGWCEGALGLLPAELSPWPPHQLCVHETCHQSRFSSRASQLGLSSTSPLQECFSCKRKASLTGFLLTDPRVGGRVILVSLWPRSLPPAGSPESTRMKTCDFMPQERWRSQYVVNTFNIRMPKRSVRQRLVSNQNTTQETWKQPSTSHCTSLASGKQLPHFLNQTNE